MDEDNVIVIRCACGKAYKVPTAKAGGQARCRACGEKIQIPVPAQAARPVASSAAPIRVEPEVFDDEEVDDPLAALASANSDDGKAHVGGSADEEASSPRRSGRAKKRAGLNAALIGIVVLIGVAATVTLVLYFTGVFDGPEKQTAEKDDEKKKEKEGTKANDGGPSSPRDGAGKIAVDAYLAYQPPKTNRVPATLLKGEDRVPIEQIDGVLKKNMFYCSAIPMAIQVPEGWEAKLINRVGAGPTGPAKHMVLFSRAWGSPSDQISVMVMLTRNDPRDFTRLGPEAYFKASEAMRAAVFEETDDLPPGMTLADMKINNRPFKVAVLPSDKPIPGSRSVIMVTASNLHGVVLTINHGPDATLEELHKLLGAVDIN